MSSRPQVHPVPDVAAEQAVKGLTLPDPARALLAPGMTARELAEKLLAEGYPGEAADVVARWLPAREGVYWACLCVRSAAGEEVPVDARAPLLAAERWVSEPSEGNRRAAEKEAEAASWKTPAALAAGGAFLSGGNLAPEASGSKVPPAPDLAPRAVNGAVRLAGVVREPEKAPERYREFAALGLDVAAGRRRWGG